MFVDNDRDRDAARFILGLIGLFMLGWWISGMLFFLRGRGDSALYPNELGGLLTLNFNMKLKG